MIHNCGTIGDESGGTMLFVFGERKRVAIVVVGCYGYL